MSGREALFGVFGFGAALTIAAGAWYAFAPDEGEAHKQLKRTQQQLAEAKQKAAELEKAKKAEEQSRLALESARADAAAARKTGDATKPQDAQAAKLAAERAARERAERQAAEKAAIAKQQAELRAAQERIAAAERAAQERIAAAERETREAERRARERITQQPGAFSSGDTLFEQAATLEREGRHNEAIRAYTRAARAGSGKAAKRLGEIYDKGLPGISRDYAESLKWYNAARVLGEDVPMAKSRNGEPPVDRMATTSLEMLYQRGSELEKEGKISDATHFYKRGACGGHIRSAHRLGYLYDKGAIGVGRSDREALKWYNVARLNADASRGRRAGDPPLEPIEACK